MAHVEATSAEISERKHKLAELTNQVATNRFAAQDSALFIATLKNKLAALTEAGIAAREFGALTLEFCPACGTAVGPDDQHGCYLCKAEVEDVTPEERFLRIIQSTQAQLEQSQRLQRRRGSEVGSVDSAIEKERRKIAELTAQLEALQTSVVSSIQAELTLAQTRMGFLASQLERLTRDRVIIDRVQTLRLRKDDLNAAVARLKSEIETLRSSSTAQVANALTTVAQETRRLLAEDLDRQAEFKTGEIVSLDYRANRYSLDGRSSFSASSQVYFRNSVYIATLMAADRVGSMRHLNSIILENLEDKGMEPDRYHNLHRVLVDNLNRMTGPWQAIVATADWNSSLTDGFRRVGRKYTHERRTLDL